MDTGYLLAVDGGQTSTKSLVAALDGTIVGHGLGGPADHFHGPGGLSKNRSAIHDAVRSALDEARVDPAHVQSIALGLTGASPGGPEVPIVEGMVREMLQPEHIVVVPDYVTNLAGASAGAAGVVVVAGGGAIAYGVLSDGSRQTRAGGMGYLLGDEGSAFDIGRRAVVAAARASDGRGDPTSLEAIVRDAFHVDKVRDLTKVVYAAGFARERLSALTPLVVREAEAGDAVALSILTYAARELAVMALAVVRDIATAGETIAIYPTGGVFKAGAILERPFAAEVLRGWPAADIRTPSYPPVIGALLLALRALGTPIDARWFQRVDATLDRSNA